jgi:V/A-type H+/Na+-transporting ATPase subunit K
MDPATISAIGHGGAFAAIAIAAIGSGLGCGAAGTAAVGAWKRCYAQNKPAPFQLVVFAGAPLSQTIYGMILMFIINGKIATAPAMWPLYLILGITAGLGLGVSSWWQGIAGAAACDAFAETSKGFVNYLMALGIIETVSIFVMAFGIVLLATV